VALCSRKKDSAKSSPVLLHNTDSLRPRTLAAEGRIHEQLKAAYTSSFRPHTRVALCSRLRSLHIQIA
jgi:hypothetical protein